MDTTSKTVHFLHSCCSIYRWWETVKTWSESIYECRLASAKCSRSTAFSTVELLMAIDREGRGVWRASSSTQKAPLARRYRVGTTYFLFPSITRDLENRPRERTHDGSLRIHEDYMQFRHVARGKLGRDCPYRYKSRLISPTFHF